MIETLREQNEMVQTARGVYNVIETVSKGGQEEIHALRAKMIERYSKDRRCVKLSTDIITTYEFNGTTFESMPRSILHVFVILSPQTLGA